MIWLNRRPYESKRGMSLVWILIGLPHIFADWCCKQKGGFSRILNLEVIFWNWKKKNSSCLTLGNLKVTTAASNNKTATVALQKRSLDWTLKGRKETRTLNSVNDGKFFLSQYSIFNLTDTVYEAVQICKTLNVFLTCSYWGRSQPITKSKPRYK